MKNVIDTLIIIIIVNANIENLDSETIARISTICSSKWYITETILSALNEEIRNQLLQIDEKKNIFENSCFSFIFLSLCRGALHVHVVIHPSIFV